MTSARDVKAASSTSVSSATLIVSSSRTFPLCVQGGALRQHGGLQPTKGIQPGPLCGLQDTQDGDGKEIERE